MKAPKVVFLENPKVMSYVLRLYWANVGGRYIHIGGRGAIAPSPTLLKPMDPL